MSRMEEECIVYVGRNRSGIDSGEIDWTICTQKFERQPIPSLIEIIKALDYLKQRCCERIIEIEATKESEE